MGGHAGIGAVAFLAAGGWIDAPEGETGNIVQTEDCVIAHPSTGVYDITLQQPCNEAAFYAAICLIGSSPQRTDYSLEHVSDSLKRLRFTNGDDAVNRNFTFVLTKGTWPNRRNA